MKQILFLMSFGLVIAQTESDTLSQAEIIDPDTTIVDAALDTVPVAEPEEILDEEDGLVPLPPLRLEEEKMPSLEMGDTFFEYEPRIEALEVQIDSLKKMIKFYEKAQEMPTIDKDLLNLIKIPQLQHRIELTNGTVIIGELVEENEVFIILQTSIGRLKIDREKVERIIEEEPVAPNVELMGDPFINVFPDREEISGMVKNTGQIRADFVRVVANLWMNTTDLAGKDSSFVSGSEVTYSTGVITDSALEPGAASQFKVIVPLNEKKSVEYRTYEIHWDRAE